MSEKQHLSGSNRRRLCWEEIGTCLSKYEIEILGDPESLEISNLKPIASADSETLVWVNPSRKDKQQLVDRTNGRLIICDDSIVLKDADQGTKCLVLVSNPRLVFSDIVRSFFVTPPEWSCHPTAVIDPGAIVHPNTVIGPGTVIGKCTIGEGTVIYGNCHIYDAVTVGRNVQIHAGCTVGGEGFGFTRDETSQLHKFPHLGGVLIEDDVELQTGVNVDRGTLSDTVVGAGTKIDSGCHIAHNVQIGADTLIAAHAMIAGSVCIGKRCWIGPSVVIRDGVTVGDDASLAIGALVMKSVEPETTVIGNPAVPLRQYRKQLKRH